VYDFPGYRDVEPLAEGGLGRLYRATRISTGGIVAIKELREMEFASEVSHRARRELDALLKLKGHPYVVSVEEIIDGPVGPALVMEYAPGGSLHDRVLHGPLSGPEVVLAGQHVVSALGAAHECGIIHRDVKPHNLLVGAFGQVKVCDFGIAAIVMGPSGRTQTQAFTLAYASPEELDGEVEVGPPADVYSFSATWVHLMTGRRPTFRDRLSGASMDISLPTGAIEPALRPVLVAIRAGLAHQPEDRPTMDDLRVVFDETSAALGDRRIQRLVPISVPVEIQDEAPTIARPVVAPADVPAPVAAPASDDETDLTVRRESPSVPDPERSVSPKWSKRKRLVAGAGLAAVIVAAGAAFLTLTGDDGPDTAERGETSTTTASPSTTSTVSPTLTTAIKRVSDDYKIAMSVLAQKYGALDKKYFVMAFDDPNPPFEQIAPWCSEASAAELGYWDMLLKSDRPTPAIGQALEAEAFAEADLIGALDACAATAPDAAAIDAAYAYVQTMNGIAFDLALKTRALLGIPAS
jgi:serine/threonine protein kinase